MKAPTAFGTSPKYDMDTLNNNRNTFVGFGGGRRGPGVVARPVLSEVEGLIEACNLIDQMRIAEQNQDLRQGSTCRVTCSSRGVVARVYGEGSERSG